MNYQDYIDLGFERIDLDDSVEFKQTGYGGFALTVLRLGDRLRFRSRIFHLTIKYGNKN